MLKRINRLKKRAQVSIARNFGRKKIMRPQIEYAQEFDCQTPDYFDENGFVKKYPNIAESFPPNEGVLKDAIYAAVAIFTLIVGLVIITHPY